MCFAFYFIAENDFFSCLGFVFMQSFRLYHLFSFASRWEWMKCGIFCLCFFAWRLFRLVQSACCGFSSLLFSSYAHAMGFPRLLFYSHAQFPLRDCMISFQGGLSRLLFLFLRPRYGFPRLLFLLPRPVSAPRHID